MTDTPSPTTLSVLCVDDNAHVAEAIRVKLERSGGFKWQGWLPSADRLAETVEQSSPRLVLIDVDLPGKDPFEALADFAERFPQSRAIMFSGHVRGELITRAFNAGAWGYVSKNDGDQELVLALHRVAGGEVSLSPEARRALNAH